MMDEMTTESVHQRFRDELRAFVGRHVRPASDAEDVLQQVFLNVHRSLEKSNPPRQLRGWLYRIARNAIVDWARTRKGSSALALDESIIAADTQEQPEEATAALSRCIRPMIESLPAAYRDALMRTELEGLTQFDAARQAGISLSGMKSRTQRGRERLRQALLQCCSVELDRRNQPVRFEKRDGQNSCTHCG